MKCLLKAAGPHDKSAIGIPYRRTASEEKIWLRIRSSLNGDSKKKFRWRKGDTGAPLYGSQMSGALPAAGYVVLLEGETDCLTCWHNGFPALGLPGASNWDDERHAPTLDGAPVIFVIVEQDTGGAAVLRWLARSRIRDRVRLVTMPAGAKDPSELWCRNPNKDAFKAAFEARLEAAEPWDEAKHGAKRTDSPADSLYETVSYESFFAYMPDHRYIYRPTGGMWPAVSVNTRLPILEYTDEGDPIQPNIILDKTRPVEQVTWLPGAGELIKDKYVREGGWDPHQGGRCFNLYRAPIIKPGNPAGAQRWLDHIFYLYPDDIDRLLDFIAFKVQNPGIKINHAKVLGGSPGIGKDTAFQPVKDSVGPWNFREIDAHVALEPNNDFLQSVFLLISEADDSGPKINPFQFYNATKTFIAAPPTTLRINVKYIREFIIFNLCSVVINTNNQFGGLYLPRDDRRHDVLWSKRKQTDSFFHKNYFTDLYKWFDAGESADVTAFLLERRLEDFDPKAPPPKTPAFWNMADAGRSSAHGELSDVLDALDRPDAFTLGQLTAEAEKHFNDLSEWLKDRANRRTIPHRLVECGYSPIRNPDAASDGHWKLGKLGRRGVVYAKEDLSQGERVDAARKTVADFAGRSLHSEADPGE